jgi:arginase family enzyme
MLETHARVERAVSALRELGLVTLCVGGGHDLSLPAIAAVSASLAGRLGGINLDAHLDVRETLGSGMPFRRLIEGRWLDPQRFVELGLGRFVNDERDLAWLRAQGGSTVQADTILERGLDAQAALAHAAAGGPAFLSIDLDALDQSVAPGVSAPNPLGLPLRDAAKLAEAAGAHSAVEHFDLMELNPSHDIDGRTGRSAAVLFLHFVAGFQRRAR